MVYFLWCGVVSFLILVVFRKCCLSFHFKVVALNHSIFSLSLLNLLCAVPILKWSPYGDRTLTPGQVKNVYTNHILTDVIPFQGSYNLIISASDLRMNTQSSRGFNNQPSTLMYSHVM